MGTRHTRGTTRGLRGWTAGAAIALVVPLSGCSLQGLGQVTGFTLPALVDQAAPSSDAAASPSASAAPSASRSASAAPSTHTGASASAQAVKNEGEAKPSAAPTATASPSAPDTPATTPAPSTSTAPVITDQLSRGSKSSEVGNGWDTLKLRYWSTLSKQDWDVAAVKPLTVSVRGSNGGDKAVRLEEVRVVVEVLGSHGWASAPEGSVSTPTVAPGSLVSGTSQSQFTITVGALPDDSLALRYTLGYDVVSGGTLTQTFSSFSDTVTTALAPREE